MLVDEHPQGAGEDGPGQPLTGDGDGQRDHRVAQTLQRPGREQPGEGRDDGADQRTRRDDGQRRHQRLSPQPAVGDPGHDRGGDDGDQQRDDQRPLGRGERDVPLPGDGEDDRVAQAGHDRAGERGEGQAGDQPTARRRGSGRSVGVAAVPGAHARSKIVALAIPPPSHMVCSP